MTPPAHPPLLIVTDMGPLFRVGVRLTYRTDAPAADPTRLPYSCARRARRRAGILRLRHLRVPRAGDRPAVLPGRDAGLAAAAADLRHLLGRLPRAPAGRDRDRAFRRSPRAQADVHVEHLPDGGADAGDRPTAHL